ncbi:hypothetical protein K8T06_01555, partial [bacterium]|nr:hypothetical protein [bacterium]
MVKLYIRCFFITCFLIILTVFSILADDEVWQHEIVLEGNEFQIVHGASQVDSLHGLHLTYGKTELKYAYQSSESSDYQVETVYGSSPAGIVPRLDVTTDNRPIIIWFDKGSLSLKLAEKYGSEWIFETIVILNDPMMEFGFCLDSLDQPCISLVDPKSEELTYLKKSEGKWSSIIVGSHPSHFVQDLRMQLDSLDRPHILIKTLYKLYYYFPTDGGWSCETVVSSKDVDCSDFVLDELNQPRIVYMDKGIVSYCWKSVSGWQKVQVGSVVEYSWLFEKMKFSCGIQCPENGTIWITYPYYDCFGNTYYRMIEWNGLSSILITELKVDCKFDFQSDFTFRNGNPSLVFYEGLSGNLCHYEYRDGSHVNRIVDREILNITNHSFKLDNQDYGHIVCYSSENNEVIYLKETLSGWQKEIVMSGAPLNQHKAIKLALCLDSDSLPVIVCGIQDSSLFALKPNQSGWEQIIVVENDFDAVDLDMTMDDHQDLYLLWRTNSIVSYVSENSDFKDIYQVSQTESMEQQFIGSVEIRFDKLGRVLAGFSKGFSNSFYHGSYGLDSINSIIDLASHGFEELCTMGGINKNIFHTIYLAQDCYGDVHHLSAFSRYCGCPPPCGYYYFGKLSGYPSVILQKSTSIKLAIGSLSTDSQGNPWCYFPGNDSICSMNLNNNNESDVYTRNYWIKKYSLEMENDINIVDMHLTSRDIPRLCYPLSGNIIVSTPVLDPIDLQLRMPHNYFAPGDPCNLKLSILNGGSEKQGIPLWTILEFAGQYFYWPSWDSNTDYRRINIPKGETIIDLLPEFPWPDTGPDIIQGNYV